MLPLWRINVCILLLLITSIIIIPFLNTRQNAALAQSCLDKLIYKHYDHLMHLIIIIIVRQVKQEDRTVAVELNTNMKEIELKQTALQLSWSRLQRTHTGVV